MKIITKYSPNFNFNVWLSGAKALGWKVKVLNKECALGSIEKNDIRYRLFKGEISANDGIAARIADDKYLTNLVLGKKMPFVAQAVKLEIGKITEKQITTILKKHKKIVIKPIDKNNGVGVTTNIATLEKANQAIKQIKQLGSKFLIIENHVNALREYRIMTWKGEVVDVFERTPAFVIGNGLDTVEKLITDKNILKEKIFTSSRNNIVIDSSLINLVKIQGLETKDIVNKNKKIKLRQTCNISQGGEVKKINLKSIHPDYQKMSKDVFKITDLNYCGIDLMTDNIEINSDPSSTIINELNKGPGQNPGYYADLEENKPLLSIKNILQQIELNPA